MMYGEKFTETVKLGMEVVTMSCIYKRAEWGGYHTNDEGNGLWDEDGRQIIGTCDFTVRGCKHEKSAVAKIRRLVKSWDTEDEDEDYLPFS